MSLFYISLSLTEVSFSGLIKWITPKIRMLCFAPFEPFMFWDLSFWKKEMRSGLNWSPERVSVGEEGEGQSVKRGRDRKGEGTICGRSSRKNQESCLLLISPSGQYRVIPVLRLSLIIARSE